MIKISKKKLSRKLQDALKFAVSIEEQGRALSEEGLAGHLGKERSLALGLIEELATLGFLDSVADGWKLSDEGRLEARKLLRAHRIYEKYLAEKTSTHETDWHIKAEAMEHVLTEDEVNRMAQELGYPRFDPHGDPIPTRTGELEVLEGIGLHKLEVGDRALIVHVEDEPPVVYEVLVKAGFAPEMELWLKAVEDGELLVDLEGKVVKVAMGSATKVLVRKLEPAEVHPLRMRLTHLGRGMEARIVKLSPACRGAARRRLLDLGLVPGTTIRTELQGAFSFPRGYRLRGTLIALREQQAEKIIIEEVVES